jgi:hypothetical protein
LTNYLFVAQMATDGQMILKNAVETTDSTDVHGYSINYKFVMIHPRDEGVSTTISP